MYHSLRYVILFITSVLIISCNKDDIPDPYQPENLPVVNRIDFISGIDSSVYVFDANMNLTKGRDNHAQGITGYEWFTMQYSSDGKQLTGAEYEVSRQIDSHKDPIPVSYSRDDRNMLSRVTREGWTKTLSFAYDENYRLKQVTVKDANGYEQRYTITYSGSNVSSVEEYLNLPNEKYVKTEYSDYDNNPNPFRFLVNVFYAPMFSSVYGVARYDNIPFGMFLSANNPKTAVEYTKNESNEYIATGNSATFSYEYDEENKYPVQISGGGLNLEVKYY